MPTTDEEKLVISLEARLSKYEREMKRATQISSTTARKIEGDFSKLDRSLRNIGSGLNRIGISSGSILKAFGIAELINKLSQLPAEIGRTIQKFGDLADAAEKVGISAEDFQKLQFAAEQLGASAEEIEPALRKFSDSLGEAQRGSGKLGELFKAANVPLKDAAGNFRSLNDMLAEFADIVAAAPTRQLQQDLVMMASGRGGAGLVTFFSAGASAIARLGKEAKDAGKIVDEELVQKADELSDKWASASARIATGWHSSLIKMAAWTNDFIDTVNKIEKAGTDLGDAAFDVLGRDIAGIVAETKAWREELFRLAPVVLEIEKLAGTHPVSLIEQQTLDRFYELDGLLKDGNQQIRDLIQADLTELGRDLATAFDPLSEWVPLLEQAARALGLIASTDLSGLNLKPFEAIGAGGAISDFVSQVVQAESGGRAGAKNPASTATGAGQFLESTWLDLFKRVFADQAAQMSDTAILALRNDMATSRAMIEAYAQENAAVLQKAGLAITAANLHLAHFLGPAGAAAVLKAAPGTPISSISAITAAAQAANPTILGAGATRESVLAYAAGRAGLPTEAAAKTAADEAARAAEAAAKKEAADRQKAIDDYQAIINAREEALGITQTEIDLFGQGNQKLDEALILQEEMNRLKDLGLEKDAKAVAAAELYAQTQAAKNAQLVTLDETQNASIERLDEMRDLSSDVFGGIVSDLRAGASAGEVFVNILDKIIAKLGDMAVNMLTTALFGAGGTAQTGLLGGLLGGLIPGRQHGGSVEAGSPYVVGETQPELFVADVSGRIMPSVPRMGGASASIINGQLRGVIDVNPSPLFMTSVAQTSARMIAENNRRIPAYLADRQRRGI